MYVYMCIQVDSFNGRDSPKYLHAEQFPYSVTISNRGERKEVRKYVKGESRNEAVIPRQGTSVGKFSECLCSGGGNKLELIKEECRVNKGKRLT